MSLDLTAPNPLGTSWERWSALMTQELAGYNVPNPTPEPQWFEWAVVVYANPEIVELGIADPVQFSSWRDWAATLLQVTN